jgi:ATP-dependent Clp protease ATP-binding subunit ClpA
MFERFSVEARMAVRAAVEEAARRGDRRVGTEHLLLGLLAHGASSAVDAVGIDLATARTGLDRMDQQAMSAIGIDAGHIPPLETAEKQRRVFLTSAAKNLLRDALRRAVASHSRELRAEHLLLAVLACDLPDPAALLLATLGVDPAAVRQRLRDAA